MARDKANYNSYMRKYMLERYHRRMANAIVFLGGKCIGCGSEKDLECHHRNPDEKEGTISNIWGYSDEVFYSELKKCELLCHKCHVSKHSARETHGTLSSYRYCKCEICKKAWSKWNSEYRKRKRLESHCNKLVGG